MFQEFPKMLYQGERSTVVHDADEEKTHRVEGWHDFGQPPAAQPEKQATGKASSGAKKAQAGSPAAQPE